MKKQEFESMVNKAKELGYEKIFISLKAISSCGGYSSSQCYFSADISMLEIGTFLTIYAKHSRHGKYNIFSVAKNIFGGEPIMVTYSDILCIVGVKEEE